jgi:hypothetical protein
MAEDTVLFESPTMNAAVLAMQDVIQQNHDIRGGKKTIHLNKSLYFSKLDTQNDDQFNKMVEMAPVYVLYPKVVDGFVGTIFAKEPTITGIEFNDKQKELNKNVDLLGNDTTKFSESIVSEVIENGFCASMNDYSDNLSRPFLRLIKPSQFISFRTNSDDGYPKISQFIFKEEIETPDPLDEFQSMIANQYTVLDFSSNPDNENLNNYRVRIFQGVPAKTQMNPSKSEKMYLKSTSFPKMDGKFFDRMPLTIHGIESNNYTIKKSLLQDISDMNISVMQRVVDQVYMLHWTALPTPYIIGSDEKDSPDTIGPSKVWYIENPDAKVGMLEFTGNSARAHQDYIDNLLYIMAATGAQILKKEGVSRETATSVLVRTASQTSLVSTMVKNVSGQIQSALEVHWKWSGVTIAKDYEYKLNDDFIKVDMEPNAQIALVKSWLDGAISHETVFHKMKEGEIVPPGRTFEEEKALISKDKPPFFEKEIDAKNAESLAEKAESSSTSEDDMSGSNLENGNIENPQATEQV